MLRAGAEEAGGHQLLPGAAADSSQHAHHVRARLPEPSLERGGQPPSADIRREESRRWGPCAAIRLH